VSFDACRSWRRVGDETVEELRDCSVTRGRARGAEARYP
jgi:hypothetical protein